jgi:hypothetical protein
MRMASLAFVSVIWRCLKVQPQHKRIHPIRSDGLLHPYAAIVCCSQGHWRYSGYTKKTRLAGFVRCTRLGKFVNCTAQSLSCFCRKFCSLASMISRAA